MTWDARKELESELHKLLGDPAFLLEIGATGSGLEEELGKVVSIVLERREGYLDSSKAMSKRIEEVVGAEDEGI